MQKKGELVSYRPDIKVVDCTLRDGGIVNDFKFDDEKLLEIVKKNFNFEVGNIISELDLRKPVYHKTSCYGHFGDPQFTWEKVKKLEY